jgi:hypothetical protein
MAVWIVVVVGMGMVVGCAAVVVTVVMVVMVAGALWLPIQSVRLPGPALPVALDETRARQRLGEAFESTGVSHCSRVESHVDVSICIRVGVTVGVGVATVEEGEVDGVNDA